MSEWAIGALLLEEFLDTDKRPSFVVDLSPSWTSSISQDPHVCFRNSSFTSDYSFDDSLNHTNTHERNRFANWALALPSTSFIPSFEYRSLTWVATTLRDRWRVIQASISTAYLLHNDQTSFLPTSLSPRAAKAQLEHLKLSQNHRPNHDWTAAKPPPFLSPHVQLLRECDWARTPLGPLSSWSPLLRLMVNLITVDPNPAVMFWGPEMASIYNEPYVKFLNHKHPQSLGEPFVHTWPELYADPATASGLDEIWRMGIEEGKATRLAHQTFMLLNGSRLEERIFNLTLIPIIDSHGNTRGFYEPLAEITTDYINDRRSESLRRLGELTSGEEDPVAFFKSVTRGLCENDKDFPFALLYSGFHETGERARNFSLRDAIDNGTTRLESFDGLMMNSDGLPAVHQTLMHDADFMEALKAACGSSEVQLFNLEKSPLIKPEIMENPSTRGFGVEAQAAVILPIQPTTQKGVIAVLVLGVNPRRPFDQHYEDFVRGLARHISASLASVLLVNEQKRLTGKAVEMEQRAMAMIEVSPVGSFLIELDGTIIYSNERWFQITAYQEDSFYEKSWLTVVDDECIPALMEAWDNLVHSGVEMNIELKLLHDWVSSDPATDERISGRTWVYAQATLQQIGKKKLVTGAFTDISRQKWAEGRQAERRLEALELKRQQENFMDMTSHEMRNPLSAIFQCADSIISTLTEFHHENQSTTSPLSTITSIAGKLSRRSVGSPPVTDNDPIAYAIEAAGIITQCAQHQKRIVDDVLVLSKVDAKLIEIHPIDVQPRVLVQNAVKMFAAELVAIDALMSFEVLSSFHELQVDWVRLDPGRLLQVLINLCTNAIKFTAESATRKIVITVGASKEPPVYSSGGVRYVQQEIDEEFDDPTVKDEWGDGETLFLQFQVADSGRGMSAEEMKLLFQRFSQASPRTHTQYGGSGLGLFIARLLSKLQGGEIGVSSVPGQGSTFAFYVKVRRIDTPHGKDVHTSVPELNIPVAAPELISPEQGLDLTRDIRPCSDFTILIVEDNLVNQRVLSKQLSKLGFAIAIANNGQESIDFIRSSQFWHGKEQDGHPLSLVLMDVEMPVMNGTEATRKIRLLQADGSLTGHIPIIAITANARSEQIAQAKDSGMDDLVSKPFRIPELLQKVELFVGPLSSTKGWS